MLSKNFVFYFDPDDVGQNPPGSQYEIPESWSYTEFWMVVNNMFGENETKYRAENVSINLLVMVDELNGYLADQGYCNFAFESYTSETGKRCWRLTGWWDRTAVFADERLGVAPASVGKVLAVFK